jgi:D-aminopeptidase
VMAYSTCACRIRIGSHARAGALRAAFRPFLLLP